MSNFGRNSWKFKLLGAIALRGRKSFSFLPGWPSLSGDLGMTVNRLFLLAYAAVFLALSVFAGVFFYRTYAEFLNLKAQEAENRHRLAETEMRLAEQRDILERLQQDPAFVERMIRDRLGYARPDEIVFRFDD